MTAAVNGAYGSYNYQSPESRALSSITQESYDYRDQGKLINKLTGDVSYLASYMRKMQQGIDSANQNVVQQLQSLINDFLVIIGGGGDTGFDFGDLKYVLQAIGALFGFGPGLSLPINLGQAASHFFSEYVLGLANFEESINVIIDSALATILDIFGEVPILGQAAQGLAVFITGLRDGINTTIDNLGDLISDLWNNPVQVISNLLAAMIPGLDASKILTGQFAQSMINGLTTTLTNINNFIQDVVDKIIGALTGIPIIGGAIAALVNGFESLFNGLFGQPTPKATIASAAVPSLDASKVATGTLAATTIPNLDGAKITTGSVAAARIAALDATKITSGVLGTGVIPALPQSKITDLTANLSSITTNSSDTINYLFDAFDGTTGNTNKTVSEMRARGATVRGSAVAGETNSLTALTNAAAAAAAAATADGKAVVAQAAVDSATALLNASITAGANLIPDPGFEDASLDAARKATSGSVASWWNAVTDVVKSGSRAMEITFASSGVAYPSLNLVPTLKSTWSSAPTVRIPCKPGQVFYMSQWVYLRSPNTGTREMNMYLATFNQANSIQYQFVQAFPALDVWTKIEGYFVVNRADVVGVVPLFGAFRPGQQLNAKAVVDDVVMIDVTDAYNAKLAADAAQLDADAAQSTANTGVTNAATAQAQANLGVTNAATAQTTANVITSDFSLFQKSGDNLIPNPNFESSQYPVPYATFTTEDAHTGTQSLKVAFTTTPMYPQPLVGAGGSYRLKTQPGRAYYYEFWAKGKASNTIYTGTSEAVSFGFWMYKADGVHYTAIRDVVRWDDLGRDQWVKFSGVKVIPNSDLMIGGELLVLMYMPLSVNGQVVYLDDFVLRDVTEAYNAQLDADAAQAQANTATTNAATADGKAVTATTNAATAQGLSTTAMGAGSNLLTNFGFENTNFSNAATFSTEQAYQGSRSWKWTVNPGVQNYVAPFQAMPPGVGTARFQASAWDTFYFEMMVFPASGNSAGDYIRVYIRGDDPSFNQVAVPGISFSNSTLTKGQWNKISGTLSIGDVPSCATGVLYLTFPPAEGNNVYYFDNAALHRITEANAAQSTANTGVTNAATADGKAVSAQAQANTATTNAATADGKAVTADGKAVTAQTAAATADGKAVTAQTAAATAQTQANLGVTNAAAADGKADVAQSVIGTSLSNASNLFTNGDFENTSLPIVGGTYTTEQAYSGTRSIKLVTTGSWHGIYPQLTLTGDIVKIPASEGDVFAFEAYIMGKSTNTGATDNWFQAGVYDKSGTWLTTLNACYKLIPVGGLAWSKISGTATMPANTAWFSLDFLSYTAVANDVIYWDAARVYRITEAAATNTKLYNSVSPANTILTAAVPGLQASKITSGEFGPAQIAANAITNAKVATDAIATANIQASAVTGAKTTGLDAAKITTGTMSQAQVSNLSADLAAKLPSTQFELQAADFTNLVAGSDFENAVNPWQTATGFVLDSTSGAHSGTKSMKLSGTATAFPGWSYDVSTTYPYGRRFECKAGDQFYMEAWAKRNAAYVSNDSAGPRFRCVRGTGSAFNGQTIEDINLLASTMPVADTWYKLTLTVTVPDDGTSSVYFVMQGLPANALGNVWVDDLVVRRVVVPDAIAALPQSKVTNLSTDLTAASNAADAAATTANAALPKVTFDANKVGGNNLATNPSFEDTTQYLWSGSAYSTDYARTGTRSAKLTAVAGADRYVSPINATGNIAYINVVPGQVFYVEFWMYQTGGTVTNSSDGSTSVLVQFFNGGNFNTPVYASIALSAATLGSAVAHNNVWTKVSGTFTTPAGSYRTMRMLIRMSAVTANNTVRYYDDVVIREITESAATNTALYDSVTPASTVLSNVVPALDASKITTGEFGSAQIAANAITNTKLVNDAVTAAKIGSNAVTDVKINANAVTTAKIADLAVSGAKTQGLDAAKITSGTMAQAQVFDLPATVSKFETIANVGNNLVADPDFENSLLDAKRLSFLTGSTWSYDTSQKYTGTRSLKCVSNGTYAQYYATSNMVTGTGGYMKVKPGQVFYLSFWVYANPANTGIGRIEHYLERRSATLGIAYQIVSGRDYDTPAEKGVWLQQSAYVTIPDDGRDLMRWYSCGVRLGNNSGDTFWFDNLEMYDVTEVVATNKALYGPTANTPGAQLLTAQIPTIDAGTKLSGTVAAAQIGDASITNAKLGSDINAAKITSGTMSQAQVSTLQDDLAARGTLDAGDNLANNPGFEIAGLFVGANAIRAVDQPRNGSASAKVTMPGNYYGFVYPIVNRTTAVNIPTNPGDVYYFECWIKGRSINTASTAPIWLQTSYWRTGLTPANNSIQAVQANAYHNDAWTKYSGYLPAMPADTYQVQFYLAFANTLPAGNVYYVDDMKLYRVTDQIAINRALYGPTANAPGTAILTAQIPNGVDATKLSGTLDEARIPTLAPAKISGLPTDVSVDSTLNQHTSDLAALKDEKLVSVNKGKQIAIDFAGLPNNGSLPTTGSQRWSTLYSGTGPATWGIVNGRASWTGTTSGSRSATIVYLGDGTTGSETTLTDYQSLRGVLVNAPINNEFTAMARVTNNANSFAAGQNPNNYVWASAIANLGFLSVSVTGSMGCVVNGVSIPWVTGIPLTWSTEMSLKCGVDGNARRYQVFSGTQLVLDFREDNNTKVAGGGTVVRAAGAALSNLGEGFRRWGAIARYNGNNNSGTVSSVSVTDDPPIVYAGSVARIIRTSTTAVTMAAGENALAANFWDDDEFKSLDITYTLSTGTFKVTDSKMYLVAARIRLSAAFAALSTVNLQVSTNNGSTWTTVQRGNSVWPYDAFHNAQSNEHALSGNWLQYLNAGDMIRLSTQRAGSVNSAVLRGSAATTGVAAGSETYFSISALG